MLTFTATAKPEHTERMTAPHLPCERCCRSHNSEWCPKHQPHRPNSPKSACTQRYRGGLGFLRAPRCHQSASLEIRTLEQDALIKAIAAPAPREQAQTQQKARGAFDCQGATAGLTHNGRRSGRRRSAATSTDTLFSRSVAAGLDGHSDHHLAANRTLKTITSRSLVPRLAAPLTASTN